jgi:plastocyanin
MTRALLLPMFAFLGLASCGDDAEPPADVTVNVTDFLYTPQNVTIKPGQTVEWVIVQGSHDVASGTQTGTGAGAVCNDDGKFKSAILPPGKKYRHTFEAAGTYPYFCTPHCIQNQVGTVVVAP